MNVFRLSDDPKLAAQYHCDMHCNKMLLEAVQCLNTSLHHRGMSDDAFYRKTHEHHPIVSWLDESWGNFVWVVNLVGHLNDECKYRFDNGDHTSFVKMRNEWFDSDWNFTISVEREPMTEQPCAMPDEFIGPDTIESYRAYYAADKAAKDWFGYEKNREMPAWLVEQLG